mmetsp:Transcript_53880/g.165792  ORF Transcript_53880/g.165792 Transcript_53880/m.165792 type:complete len:272 (-) Transcript_53880:201-1016(-)
MLRSGAPCRDCRVHHRVRAAERADDAVRLGLWALLRRQPGHGLRQGPQHHRRAVHAGNRAGAPDEAVRPGVQGAVDAPHAERRRHRVPLPICGHRPAAGPRWRAPDANRDVGAGGVDARGGRRGRHGRVALRARRQRGRRRPALHRQPRRARAEPRRPCRVARHDRRADGHRGQAAGDRGCGRTRKGVRGHVRGDGATLERCVAPRRGGGGPARGSERPFPERGGRNRERAEGPRRRESPWRILRPRFQLRRTTCAAQTVASNANTDCHHD